MNRQTYKTKVDFSKGTMVGLELTTPPTGYIAGIPVRIWGDDSFEWVIECYEDDQDTALDLSSATVTFKVRLQDTSGASATVIDAAGVVSGASNNIVTVTCEAGDIPDELHNNLCVFWVTMTTGTYSRTVMQNGVYPMSEVGSAGTSSSSSVDIDTRTATGLTTGKVYRYDGTTWTLADPDDDITEHCELWFATSETEAVSTGRPSLAVTGNVGDIIWLDDDGAVTATEPDATTDAGRTARPVGWIRSATTIRFDGHLASVHFEEAASA